MPRLPAVLALSLLGACVDRTAPGDGTDSAATTEVAASAVTTTTPTSSTSSTSSPTGTTSVCEDYVFELVVPIVAPQMILLLDQSPAMLDPWDHDGDPRTPEQPRWASVRNALLTVLPPLDNLDLGLAPYPTSDVQDVDGAAACAATPGLFVPTSDALPGEVLAGLAPAAPAPGSFVGGSPLRAALMAAAPLLDGPEDQPRLIYAFTNSAPNCAPEAQDPAGLLETLDEGVFDVAADLFDAGIRISIFGIGAAQEPSPALDDHRPDGVVVSDALAELALAGVDYVDVASEAALITALSTRFETEGILCSFTFYPGPAAGQKVSNVRVDGEDFPEVASCSDDGWQFHDDVDPTIELCGNACTRFRQNPGAEVFVSCI